MRLISDRPEHPALIESRRLVFRTMVVSIVLLELLLIGMLWRPIG